MNETPVHPPVVEAERVERLAQHLREHPELVGQDPKILADEFELPRAFVRDLQRFLKPSARADNYLREAVADAWTKVARAWAWGRYHVDRLVPRAATNLAILTAVLIAALIVQSIVSRVPMFERNGSQVELQISGFGVWAIISVLLVHSIVLFRVARLPLARSSTIWTGLMTYPVLATVFVDQLGFTLLRGVVFSALSVILLCTVYGLFAFGLTVLGGATRVAVVEAAEDNRSRQELLDRLLVVRERLHDHETFSVATSPPTVAVPRFLERNVFVVTTMSIAVLGSLYRFALSVATERFAGADYLRLVANPIFFALIILLAYASGTIRRAVLVSLLAAGILQATTAIPAPPFGMTEFMKRLTGGEFLVNCIGAILLGVFAGLAARTEEHAARARRFRQNDSAALVAEWIRLHWRLRPETSALTIMVVDVRGSTAMKQDADPYVAEWSFREYQRFLERVADRFGGTVHSTSGDGAVLSFLSPNEAFAAARTVQRDLDEFNQTINRLPDPFRVRIGLHLGKVTGDLDEVQFTNVIDIAAHIEAAAPVGGIAMSRGVAETLEGEKLAQIVTEVDGVDVFIALEPTGI